MISESEVALAESLRIAERVDLDPVVRHRIAEAINIIWVQLSERSVDQAGDLIKVLQAQGLKAEVTAHYDKPKATP